VLIGNEYNNLIDLSISLHDNQDKYLLFMKTRTKLNKPRTRFTSRSYGSLSGPKKILILVILLSLLVGGGYIASKSFASGDVNVQFSAINVGNITPDSGHIGVDIWWDNQTAAEGEDVFNPCHHSSDSNPLYKNYGACALPQAGPISYYKVQHYGPNFGGPRGDFTYGIFINNTDKNNCVGADLKTVTWCVGKQSPDPLQTNWAKKVTGAAIEIYPYSSITGYYDPATSTVGGVRATINGFPEFANGGRYSVNIGNISLPKAGDKFTDGRAKVGKLTGQVTSGGIPIAKGEVQLDAFGFTDTYHSSKDFPLYGFSDINPNKESNGMYNFGILPVGDYRIVIETKTQPKRVVTIESFKITGGDQTQNFDLSKFCLGYSKVNDCDDPQSPVPNPASSFK